MRIVTFNFLGGGSARRAAHWEHLRALRPDLVLTQESPAQAPPHQTALWTEARRGWGTGLYARRLRLEPIPVRGFRGWVTGGELSGTRTRVFSVHCPAGERGYVRTMHTLIDRLRPLARDARLILGGDFNVAAGVRGAQDLVRFSPAERALLGRLHDELGLVPAWQAAHPGVPLAQTLRWAGNRSTPYHCDGLFVPREWLPRLVSCEVLAGPQWEALSDHNPVVANLRGNK